MAGEASSSYIMPEGGRPGEAMRSFLRGASLCLFALVVLYRPMSSSAYDTLTAPVVFGMLLLACVLFWVCDGALCRELRWRAGPLAVVFGAFMLWMALACLHAHNQLAAVKVWWLFATYGITAFVVLQFAGSAAVRRFLLSCFLASVVTLALYAVLHLLVYLPALRRMLAGNPEYFKGYYELPDKLFEDLLIRVEGKRAFGSFVTPNQLASFLLLGLFPLLGLTVGLIVPRKGRPSTVHQHLTRVRYWLIVGGCTAASALVLLALYLSGSKGGLLSLAFGAAVFAFGAAACVLKVPPKKMCAAGGLVLVIAVTLFLAAQRMGLAPGYGQFRASLGVRVGYWTATAQMIRSQPVMGIGPGCWEEHYTRLKEPEYEETKLAHSEYLQIWSETGTVGFALFVLLLALFGLTVLRRAVDWSASSETEDTNSPWERLFSSAGHALVVIVLVIDYFFVGTFKPPSTGIPKVLQACPWLIYIVLIFVCAAAFRLVHDGVGQGCMGPLRQAGPFLIWGLLAGLAAFLLQSAAEFTFRVPALGGSAFALGALLLMSVAPPRQHATRLGEAQAVVIVLLCLLPIMLWAGVITPRVLDYSVTKSEVSRLRGEMSRKDLSPQEMVKKAREIVRAQRSANRAIPWDSECWYDQAVAAFELAQLLARERTSNRGEIGELLLEAEHALVRAIELNPLKANHRFAMAQFLTDVGRPGQAVEYFRQAAELHPSLPESWLRFAEAAERFEGLSERVCGAYRKAMALHERQYHARNRLSPEQKAEVESKLKQCPGGAD